MRALGEDEFRGSFVNLAADQVERTPLPFGLPAMLWDALDYLGWVDPGAPEHGYLVADTSFGLVGIGLRLPRGHPAHARRTLCNLCLTQHPASGAVLMVAPRAGRAGLHHNTVGTTICADLACSLYLRGLRRTSGGGSLPETLDLDARVRRLHDNVEDFLGRVLVE